MQKSCFNRYSYGYNSPIVYSDPTGHLSIAEIENYFGYTTEQQMIDAYGQAVAKQLWNTKFTWGDVLKYDCAECIDGKGYVMLVLKGNQSDEFRGAFWGLEAIHNGHDFRGKEVSAGFLHQATDASLDLAWTAAYENWSQLPVDYEAYGASRDGMVAGTWHDYAFWRPAIWLGSLMAPVGLIPAAFSEGWGVLEEITDDILDIGHPLGKYHTAYPTIKFANRWGYLPTANTYSFLAPRSVHR